MATVGKPDFVQLTNYTAYECKGAKEKETGRGLGFRKSPTDGSLTLYCGPDEFTISYLAVRRLEETKQVKQIHIDREGKTQHRTYEQIDKTLVIQDSPSADLTKVVFKKFIIKDLSNL